MKLIINVLKVLILLIHVTSFKEIHASLIYIFGHILGNMNPFIVNGDIHVKFDLTSTRFLKIDTGSTLPSNQFATSFVLLPSRSSFDITLSIFVHPQ